MRRAVVLLVASIAWLSEASLAVELRREDVPTDGEVLQVASPSPGELFVVVRSNGGDSSSEVILHRSGGVWRAIDRPNGLGCVGTDLVVLASDDVYVSGGDLCRFDGCEWTVVEETGPYGHIGALAPAPGGGLLRKRSSTYSSSSAAWNLGLHRARALPKSEATSLLERADGPAMGLWASSLEILGTFSLYSISRQRRDRVGTDGRRSAVEVVRPGGREITAARRGPGGDVFFVGEKGLAVELKETGDAEDLVWILHETPTTIELLDVAQLDSERVVAVGRERTILIGRLTDGGMRTWTVAPAPTTFSLNSVCAAPEGGAWIGGEGGTLLRLTLAE
jgi:hypothetical protein